ncbi:MAG: ABC transporter ATP-binding protein [Reyranella sp.]
MIEIRDAGHWFRPDRWLFRRLSVEVPEGAIAAVLGPNGRGKTTLLRAVCGTLALKEGTVATTGPVGYVPQAHSAVAYRTIDMVLLGRSRRLGRFAVPGSADVAAAEACLDAVGLADIAGQRYDRLSGGQRQLVLLARALASECRVLVLDEPASALDLANQGIVLRLMRRLAAERSLAILFTTHDPDHALAVADRALILLDDADHVFGPVDKTLSEANLSRLYGVGVRRLAFADGEGRGETVVPLYGLGRRPSGEARYT